MEGAGKHYGILLALSLAIITGALPCCSSQTTRKFQFNIEWKKVTRLCTTKQLLTVNGEYPGPTIAVHEGDNVEIKVKNQIAQNTTLHWPKHVSIRHGNRHFPDHLATSEIPIVFGEWWNEDPDEVEKRMMLTGAGPDSSDAYTMNGLPGPLYPCSNQDTFIQTVEYGKTYMLRIINAALADELFFAVAKHTLTVVEVDAVYTKPFTTTSITIAPGQTTTVLMTANQVPDFTGMFVMAARPYLTSVFPFNNSTTIGFFRYKNAKTSTGKPPVDLSRLKLQNLPAMEDNAFATKFSDKIKSLASPQYPCNVPQTIDKRVITTISLNLQDCPENKTCSGYKGKSFFASMNNQSFVRPSISILESYYKNLTTRSFSSDFPEKPPNSFDYTGGDPLTQNMNTEFGTKLIHTSWGLATGFIVQNGQGPSQSMLPPPQDLPPC
ncbi:LACCASE-1 [Salix viminalis]|uniref:laccase n=1 Tax=Salix viminalis TaxID=40686 RepID=A0A9Q0SH01_SALVM|nr:LACCASE-1 [Salix viminalis]